MTPKWTARSKQEVKSRPGPCRPRERGNSGQEEPGPDTRELPHLPMSLLSQICNRREKSAFISLKSLLFCVSVRTARLPVRTALRADRPASGLKRQAGSGSALKGGPEAGDWVGSRLGTTPRALPLGRPDISPHLSSSDSCFTDATIRSQARPQQPLHPSSFHPHPPSRNISQPVSAGQHGVPKT